MKSKHRIPIFIVSLLLINFLGEIFFWRDASARPEYTLGPGDVIKIMVYEHPDLTVENRIGESGQITYPLIGAVRLGGATTTSAEEEIGKKLKEGGYIKSPNVSVTVTQFRSRQVVVLGQVNRPGKFFLERENSTLSDVLALAGGINTGGSEDVFITRRNGAAVERLTINLDALATAGDSKDINVIDGDLIYVPRYPTFYVYGAVQRPGTFRLEKKLTVAQALALGGGLTLRGTERGMHVLRRGDDVSQPQSVVSLPVQLGDELKPDDVLFVKESLF